MAKDTTTISVNEGSGSQAQEPKTVQVSQDPKNDFMTISDRIEYLRAKQVRSGPEQQELSDLQKKLPEGKEGNVTPQKNTKTGPDEKEPDGPFKEEDIIKYMYNDWLIGGLNWLYKKSYKWISYGYYYAKNRRDKLKDEKDSKYNTITTDNIISKKRVKNYEASKATIDKELKKVLKALKDIKSGRVDPANASEFTLNIINNVPESRRIDFCKAAKTMAQNAAKNMDAILLLSGTLARVQMAEEICKNKDVYNNVNSEALLTNLTKRNAILIARMAEETQQRGGNVGDLFKTLDKKIKEADKFADKQFKKARFDENGKEGRDNKALREVNAFLHIAQEEQIKEQNLQPRSPLEHLIASNKAEASLTKAINANTQGLACNAAERENNNRFKKRVNKMKAQVMARLFNKEQSNNSQIGSSSAYRHSRQGADR